MQVLTYMTTAGVACRACLKKEAETGGEIDKKIFDASPDVPIVCACGEMLDPTTLPTVHTIDICISPFMPDALMEGVLQALGDMNGIEAVIVHPEGSTP